VQSRVGDELPLSGKVCPFAPESLERELKRVRAAAAGAAQGVFGPRSLTWQIDRESEIFFGAGRALLLQLGQPLGGRRDRAASQRFCRPDSAGH
jgi:hypothetical protein